MNDLKITGFSVGGFKCFNEPQYIPIKPITLIFGPNSAGKSSIIECLMYSNKFLEKFKMSKNYDIKKSTNTIS